MKSKLFVTVYFALFDNPRPDNLFGAHPFTDRCIDTTTKILCDQGAYAIILIQYLADLFQFLYPGVGRGYFR